MTGNLGDDFRGDVVELHGDPAIAGADNPGDVAPLDAGLFDDLVEQTVRGLLDVDPAGRDGGEDLIAVNQQGLGLAGTDVEPQCIDIEQIGEFLAGDDVACLHVSVLRNGESITVLITAERDEYVGNPDTY